MPDLPCAWIPGLSTWMQSRPATVTGTYIGDGGASQAISITDGRLPSLVIIEGDRELAFIKNFNASAGLAMIDQAGTSTHTNVTKMTTSAFYVGNAAAGMNTNARTYYYILVF